MDFAEIDKPEGRRTYGRTKYSELFAALLHAYGRQRAIEVAGGDAERTMLKNALYQILRRNMPGLRLQTRVNRASGTVALWLIDRASEIPDTDRRHELVGAAQ